MPMTKAGLKAAIAAKVNAKFPPDDAGKADDFADALAEAIVTYISANALVTVTALTAVVASGAGAGGTVTGTGTGTVS